MIRKHWMDFYLIIFFRFQAKRSHRGTTYKSIRSACIQTNCRIRAKSVTEHSSPHLCYRITSTHFIRALDHMSAMSAAKAMPPKSICERTNNSTVKRDGNVDTAKINSSPTKHDDIMRKPFIILFNSVFFR